MLELTSVDAGYDGFQALFDVSLEIRSGEAVAVIGPNGAGKTTLMRVISGLIRPMQGAITMEGADLVATPAHRIVELGDRARPGKPSAVPAHDGRGQFADGRLHCQRAAEVPREHSISSSTCSPVSKSGGARLPAHCRAASSRCARSAAP